METALHRVDPDTCGGDGICVEVCPEDCLEMVNGTAASVKSREGNCILCGQCVAVCPTEALQMAQLPDNRFRDLSRLPFGYDEFLDFLKLRRSVRAFKDRPVEPELADKILAAASTAPMGMPPHSTAVTVLSDRNELAHLLKELVREYDKMVQAMSSPVGRAMIRIVAGREDYGVLKEYIRDLAQYANGAYRRDGTDRYMYHAPMLMLFHGDRRAMSYQENAHLVCHHAMLTAVTLGLGTTIIGMIPPIVDRSKHLRERYGIPKDNKVLTSLILGYPKYKYRKSIQRDLAGMRSM